MWIMVVNVISKVNSRLKFLHRQNRFFFLTYPLRRLLFNALIQPFFHYGCIAWFLNLSKKIGVRIQATQNKYTRLYLELEKMSRICAKEFLELNWLNPLTPGVH